MTSRNNQCDLPV